MPRKKIQVPGVDYTGVCSAFWLIDAAGHVAIHKRGPNCRDEQGVWDTGSGQCEFTEHPAEATVREIEQEYGLRVDPRQVRSAGFHNVVRDLPGKMSRSHWICFLFAVFLEEVRPRLSPAAEEVNHVLAPMWVDGHILAMLPRHSQVDLHAKMIGAVTNLVTWTVVPSSESPQDKLLRLIASQPGTGPLLEQALLQAYGDPAPTGSG